MEGPKPLGVEIQRSIPAQHVESAITRFLKSRLPGPKTEKSMRLYDKVASHLPDIGQDISEKIRPIVKAGAYAGNAVGTFYEGMLVATIGAGAILVGRSAVINRADMPGAFKKFLEDAKIKDIPKNLAGSVKREVIAFGASPRDWLQNAAQAKPTYEREPAKTQLPIIEKVISKDEPKARLEDTSKGPGATPREAKQIDPWNEYESAPNISGDRMPLPSHPALMDESQLDTYSSIQLTGKPRHTQYVNLLAADERKTLFDEMNRATNTAKKAGEPTADLSRKLIHEHARVTKYALMRFRDVWDRPNGALDFAKGYWTFVRTVGGEQAYRAAIQKVAHEHRSTIDAGHYSDEDILNSLVDAFKGHQTGLEGQKLRDWLHLLMQVEFKPVNSQ